MIGLRSAAALAVTETRLFGREPFAVFFSLAFPLILLLFVGSVGGGVAELPEGGASSTAIWQSWWASQLQTSGSWVCLSMLRRTVARVS